MLMKYVIVILVVPDPVHLAVDLAAEASQNALAVEASRSAPLAEASLNVLSAEASRNLVLEGETRSRSPRASRSQDQYLDPDQGRDHCLSQHLKVDLLHWLKKTVTAMMIKVVYVWMRL